MSVKSTPRLHVIPATGCNKALVLRRGPTRQVASLLWDRKSGQVELGQWLKGRIDVHKSDLSPDGRHMIIFASKAGKNWTSISRAPWLRAVAFWPFGETWFGGGAFTPDGRVFGNGFEVTSPLPDKLKPAPSKAFPSGTDGFHMGLFFPAMLEARGWRITGGERYDVTLEKPAPLGWTIHLRFEHGFRSKGTYNNPIYSLSREGVTLTRDDWEWVEPWKGGLQFACAGGLWSVALSKNGPMEPVLIHDLTDMMFEQRQAPYEGIQQ